MSRSGYYEDLDQQDLAMWRGQVASATRGKRGQRLLRDLLVALDAMPDKRLIASELETEEGDVCALGELGKARNMDMTKLDPEDYDAVAAQFDIAHQLAQGIVYMNDECFDIATPEERWTKMRRWVEKQILPSVAS